MSAAAVASLQSAAVPDSAALAWRQYICRACGLIYDEEKGDPDSGLAPGTRFEDIPDDWACPLCGVTKSDFEPYIPLALTGARSPSIGVNVVRRHDAGIVIVGGGTAGWTMAQAIRELDSMVPVTLVTGCSGDRYDKPLLSVAAAKAIDVQGMVTETGAAAAQRLGIRLMADTVAVSVAPDARSLRTTRGAVRYDHLILAHGAQPRIDACLPRTLCWAINDLRTYLKFRHVLDTPARPQKVVIAGAGLVGCEMANDLALAGHSITLLDVAARPLASVVAPGESADLLQAWGDLPITFLGGVRITRVARSPHGISVNTDTGLTVQADHVLSATGLQTPSRLADSAGIGWNNGIAVDPETLATTARDIHALGDCVSIHGQPLRFIEPIGRQARVIASKLTSGAPIAYTHSKPVVRIKTRSRPFTV